MSQKQPTALEILQWTLTKVAIAPCFVRDVHAMRESVDMDAEFFWLGYTPCRSVLLLGMVVAIQRYEKRAIYTIDDGTSVIDCILRHPTPPRPKGPPATSPNKKKTHSPSKKARFEKDGKPSNMDVTEPPPPITEPGYPVRVVGKVVRRYESRQIHADAIELCRSSLDEIDHLKRVVDLHKTKYSLAVPFIIPLPQFPTNSTTNSSISLPGSSTLQADAGVFSSDISPPGSSTVNVTNSISTSKYTLPAPRMHVRSCPIPTPMHHTSAHHGGGPIPSSPTTSSIASSTPSSPCKTSSPVKDSRFGEPPPRPKLRHPSRLHTRDLSANTFRLYVKHYMDNAPPPFPWSTDDEHGAPEAVRTPTKRSRHTEDDDDDERTPRAPFPRKTTLSTGHGEVPGLGFTLSHLRRVPELALLASRVVRAETRRREKAEREKARKRGVSGGDGGSVSQLKPQSKSTIESWNGSSRPPGSGSASSSSTVPADPHRKKMKRLFSWAVVKLYEEGSILLCDGDVRPLPIPPPPGDGDGGDTSGLWNSVSAGGTLGNDTVSFASSACLGRGLSSTSYLYSSSASASLYSHYHSPRHPSAGRSKGGSVPSRTADKSRAPNDDHDHGAELDPGADADPANLSDPPMDEEAYVPLTAQILAPYVRKAVGVLREGRAKQMSGVGVGKGGRGGKGVDQGGSGGVGGRVVGSEPAVMVTPEDIVGCLRRMDGRWARVGVWTVEEALEVLREG